MSYSNEVAKIEAKKVEAMKVALSDYRLKLVNAHAVYLKSDKEMANKVDKEIELVSTLLKEYSSEGKKELADAGKSKEKADVVKPKEVVVKKASIPSNAKEYKGHHYLVVENGPTWAKAKLEATERGGHLAIIDDKDEMNYVLSLIRTAGYVWVGAEYKSLRWTWLDGTSVDSSLCDKDMKKRNTSNKVLCLGTRGFLSEGNRDSSGWYVIEWDE
jgi:hypothetical protein